MKRNVVIFVALMTVLMCLTVIFSTHLATVASAQSPFQFVMGTDYYSPSDTVMPQKGSTFTDPNFHTSIMRITDSSDGYSGGGIENEYATVNSENSDGTYVILRANDGEVYLYNTATFQNPKHLADIFDGVEPQPRWDATNPRIFYYVYGTELRSYNIDNDVSTTIHDFKKEFPNAAYITTKVKGDASLDRRFWSFIVEDSNYNDMSVIVFDKTSNTIIGQKTSFPDSLNWASMDMSGKHCVIGYDNIAAQVFSRNFSSSVSLPAGANGHMDLALTSDGRDVMVYQNTVTDWIAMADLSTGVETQLVKIPFNVTEDIGLHFSGNCADTPGWALISTYGAKNPPQGETHSWMDTHLFMVQLKANPAIWRIAHTHAYTSLDYTGDKNCFAESYASINKEGTKVYFGSNWGTFTSDYTDTYVVTLPQGWSTNIPVANIPEFPSLPLILALMLVTLLVVITQGKKYSAKKALC